MLNMYGNMKPKFVKVFAEVGAAMKDAFGAYITETRDGIFPAGEHVFAAGLDETELAELAGY
jgi:3-methyl-2-oxobutanoate hydroxymethyltransferase